jgi:hypothetical protein
MGHIVRKKLMFRCAIGIILFVVGVLSADEGEAQGLWPNAPGSNMWVQFDNGAWGIIDEFVDLIDDGQVATGARVRFFDPTTQSTRTHVFSNADVLNGNNGAPRWVGSNNLPVSASKWARWAPWAAAAGRTVGFGSTVLSIVYPDQLGGGTLQDFCQNNATCLETGFPQCEILPGCGTFGWVNVPCSQETGGAVSVRREEPTSGTYCPLESYPEDTGWGWLINVPPAEAGSIWDELPLPSSITDAQGEDLAALENEPGQPGPLNPGGGTIPDLFPPLPMPPGLEDATAREMNPGGYPADGVGVITDPVPFPQLADWPQIQPGTADTWPQDHPSASSTVYPDGTPRTDPNAGTGTQTVNVNFPDRIDARIVDTEIVVQGDDTPLEENEINVLGMLDAGAGWLPRSCPDFSVDMMGQTLVFGSAEFCALLTNIGFLLLAMTTIGALRYGLGGM